MSSLAPSSKVQADCAGNAKPVGDFLPVEPFRSLRPHFGMLLGVDDFEALSAYHRGKAWLHSAWLHRRGVVWGYGAELLAEEQELRVQPGLALDALGRELYLPQAQCLHLGRWYEARAEDPEMLAAQVGLADGAVGLDAHLVARFEPCLDRQVPALLEPCDGASQTTAYSRVHEGVRLSLLPGPAPTEGGEDRPLPYHRLRLLFGLEAAHEEQGTVLTADQEVLDARSQILSLAEADRPAACLQAFRRFAALDSQEMGPAADVAEGEPADPCSSPARALFPAQAPAPLVLAEIRELVFRPVEGGWEADLASAEIDPTVRRTHVATHTIQELLCGSQAGLVEVPGPESPGTDATDASARAAAPVPGPGVSDAGASGVAGPVGPRVQPHTVRATRKRVAFRVDSPLQRASVETAAVQLTAFEEEGGWRELTVRRAFASTDGLEVSVDLEEELDDPKFRCLRLRVRGTGSTPLLGADLMPFAGGPGAPPGSRHDGHDFVHMIERS